jgi:3-oxoacyl-[acyl-carrier-protein] synthase-3
MSSFIGARIIGTGSALPEKRLTNADFARMVDTSDEWIVQRTGIRERRIISQGESTATLAIQAAKNAIENSGLKAEDIDLIVCATITPEMQLPATACFIQDGLGLKNIPAFDVGAACSGFIYALKTGWNFIRSGEHKNVLVVGAETLSRVTDYTDRGSCILFGDGAGAVVLSRTDTKGDGLLHSKLFADGSGWELLHLAPGSRHPISPELIADRKQYMQIHGREVYKFAVDAFTDLITDAVKSCNLSLDDVRWIIPHQANQRIIDGALDRIKFPAERAYINLEKYGNVSSASIPIALDEANRKGLIKKGDVVIFVAFGAGLTWANAVVKW